jgi:hypothetical protein
VCVRLKVWTARDPSSSRTWRVVVSWPESTVTLDLEAEGVATEVDAVVALAFDEDVVVLADVALLAGELLDELRVYPFPENAAVDDPETGAAAGWIRTGINN